MRKLLSIITALLIITPNVALADNATTLGDAYDLPVMYLNHGIDSTQTTNLTLAPPVRNGAQVLIPAFSGAIFELRRPGAVESIYASRIAVNQTTKVVTLTGTVIRDLCYTQSRTFTSCSDGSDFNKGSEVRLSNNSRRFNLKAGLDVPNNFSASGAIAFQGSGSLSIPTFATTSARDQQLGASPGGPVRTACVTAEGTCYYYIAGSWIKFGSGGSVNATTSVRGGVELLTQTNLSGGVLTDDTGAPLVPDAGMIIRHSSGAINNRNKLVATNNKGYLSGSLLGSGTPTSSTVLLGNQSWGALPSSGSGFNLGGTTCYTSDVSWTSTSYAAYDASLAQTLNVNVGSLIGMKVTTGPYKHVSGAPMHGIMNFKLGNGFARGTGSGTGYFYSDSADTTGYNAGIANEWWTVSATGGSLSVSPVLRANVATTTLINSPICFQTFVVR